MDPNIWWLVLALNLITFVLFGWDKRRARTRGRRVPEATLLWLSFFTGLLGAWFAMSMFRHKTRKSSFRWRLIAVSVINPIWLLLWWQLAL